MKTKNLEAILKSANETEKEQIIKQIQDISFCDYIHQLLVDNQLDKAAVIEASQIPRTYAYQIFQGVKQAGRDKILQLAFAMKLDLEETNRMLTIANHSMLYAKKQRDAIIIFALSNHYNLMDTNELLNELNHELLGSF